MQGARDKEKARVYSRQYYWDHRDEINAKRNANRPESAKVYREKNRDELNAYNRVMYAANKEKEHSRRKAYYESHKEESKAYSTARREANLTEERGKRCIYQARYKTSNPEKVKASVEAWKKTNPEKYKTYSQVRRARKYTNEVEKFPALEIYDRDRWTCQLCKKKVNRELRHPDPLSPSLDHIIPLAKGGTHSRENVHLAHLICNMKAYTGGIKQTRLF